MTQSSVAVQYSADLTALVGVDCRSMGIRKQEFYEGAALHLLVRGGRVSSIRYRPPLFVINRKLCVLLKYSTGIRSPWAFTFAPMEQKILRAVAGEFPTAIGMVCAADGVVAVDYAAYSSIAPIRDSAVRVACYREHGEHYEVWGPDGSLDRRVSPSRWQKILND